MYASSGEEGLECVSARFSSETARVNANGPMISQDQKTFMFVHSVRGTFNNLTAELVLTDQRNSRIL